ncbi:MarR family winged helix-turn-helix transcriptional regulator [Kineococcus sp. R86509]|uniref:MarR family winged helix-turn-helix transcriptional regulator n=1 Tax=Kineococcus sp. R86509 TaxID=3093851 RepID=UPI0036D3371F
MKPDVEDLAHDLRLVTGALIRSVEGGNTLPPITGAVLGLLARRGAMTSSDLAALRRVRPQTMAVTVKELLEAGYLATAPHPVDGRKILLDLTARGRTAVLADREGRVRRIADGLGAGLPDADLQTLARAVPVLARLVDDLGGAIDEPLVNA